MYEDKIFQPEFLHTELELRDIYKRGYKYLRNNFQERGIGLAAVSNLH